MSSDTAHIAIVKQYHADGMSILKISKLTGLSTDEVMRIAKPQRTVPRYG